MPRAELRIDGERAVVTAGAGGIGREIAGALCGAGLDVAINDVDGDALAETADELSDGEGEIVAVEGDMGDPEDAGAVVDRAVEAFGGLDVLVNNVGVAGPTKPCEEITYEEFMDTLRVDLGSGFAATKRAIPHLRESTAGRIVNLASVSGKVPLENRTPYATAKMGVIGFTRTLAVELADDGITVNAVCPGSVEGDRLERVIEGQAESRGIPVEEAEAELREGSPMDEFVSPGDVADTVLFLCSRRADRITGQDVNVSAGRVVW